MNPDEEPVFDDAMAQRLFDQQQRLLKSLAGIGEALRIQTGQAMTAAAGVQMLALGGIGIPVDVSQPVIESVDKVQVALAAFRATLVASQDHD